MSRGRTQKGSGFFNRIRSMFRTRKVAPAPVVNQTERRSDRKHETLADALKRDFVFLYYKLHGQEPPREKRFVTPQQEAEVRRVLLDADARGLSADEIIRQIFHRSDTKAFDDEFSAWEQYLPEKYLNKGTEYERQAFDVAGSVQRFIATLKIKKTPRNIAYASNFQIHICDSTNLDQPVVTLSDDSCITLLTPQNQEMFEEGKGYTYPVSYMIVDSKFFPSGAAGPIALNARSLPALSFVLDAFQQNGILEIEPTLKATLEREAPELLSYSQQKPIVVFIPYYLQDPVVTQGQFLVVDPSVLARGRNVVNVKNLRSSDLIQTAFARQKVLFMDPKTMFYIRDTIPQLWLASFGSFNMNVFKTLTPHEKVVFCLLQYIKFQEIYSLNRNPRNLNNESAIARKTLSAAEEAKRRVFAVNYAAGANPYELAENFQADDTENLRQLVKIQEDVLGSTTIRTPDDVRRLLSKFDTRRATSSGPVVVNYFGPSRVNLGRNVKTLATASRKQRVKQMLTPRNIQQKRNNILRRYKEAMAMPKKTSMLPNFLRTKKARQANKKRYYNRLQNLTNELREFNQRHGIQTKPGYGYEF